MCPSSRGLLPVDTGVIVLQDVGNIIREAVDGIGEDLVARQVGSRVDEGEVIVRLEVDHDPNLCQVHSPRGCQVVGEEVQLLER